LRWLLAGAWDWNHFEEASANALQRLGQTVVPFRWSPFFDGLGGRAERKWTIVGPATRRMNAALQRAIRESEPDVVLVWRGTHVLAQTLAVARRASRFLISYNNDDPFSPVYSTGPLHNRRMWRLFQRRIPDYDIHLVYRPVNVREMRAAGAREVHLFPPYFVPELDQRVELTPEDRTAYSCDIVFIGRYEPDGRFETLKALVDAGVRVRLFGTNWPARTLERLRIGAGRVQPVRGVEYRKALSAANMALCFLSRLNRDAYTRRIFEITACGTLLVSERTPDLERWFADGREAVFFSSPTELVSRVHALLAMPEMIEDIAAAGLARVHADRHSVDGRMEQLLSIVESKFATPANAHAIPG
jgi:hypothetical protein